MIENVPQETTNGAPGGGPSNETTPSPAEPQAPPPQEPAYVPPPPPVGPQAFQGPVYVPPPPPPVGPQAFQGSGYAPPPPPVGPSVPPGPFLSPPPSGPSSVPPSTDITDNDRLMAAIAYIFWFVGSAIVLLSESMKNRPFQRYHAIQALGVSVVFGVYTFIFLVLGFLVCCLWLLLLIPAVVSIICAIEAYQGKYFKIPALTDVMVSQGWLPRM